MNYWSSILVERAEHINRSELFKENISNNKIIDIFGFSNARISEKMTIVNKKPATIVIIWYGFVLFILHVFNYIKYT